MFAHAGDLLALLFLAFFLASSNTNSLNNFSQDIHSAKTKTSRSLWRGNFLQPGLLLMKVLVCFHFMDATTALDCDTLLDTFLDLQFPMYLVLKYAFKEF